MTNKVDPNEWLMKILDDFAIYIAGDKTWDWDGELKNVATELEALFAKHSEQVEREARIDPIRIGMMRQWLNEDRITDPKRLVTNEDLEYWLYPEANLQQSNKEK